MKWPNGVIWGFQGAPHPAAVVMADEWTKPYSRELAAFPASWVRASKFWPSTGKGTFSPFDWLRVPTPVNDKLNPHLKFFWFIHLLLSLISSFEKSWMPTNAINTTFAIYVSLNIRMIFVKPMFLNTVLGRIDNVYGDRHLVCTLRPSEPEFEEQAIVAAWPKCIMYLLQNNLNF